jgi:2-polyprenyl-3-methyl-5-hydroxy-6-metoxy-1,4-benzoquinol methylase
VPEQRFQAGKAELYKSHRQKSAIQLKRKHLRQFDREFMLLSAATPDMSVLELGCGSGLFLRYLRERGFAVIAGVDYDENLAAALAGLDGVELTFGDVHEFAANAGGNRRFDRIVLFDLLEHMDLDRAMTLLGDLRGLLAPGGRLVIRVPNATSPWGLRMQFDTFDHVTVYAPNRLRELAHFTGYRCETIVGQKTGKKRRRILEGILHAALGKVLTYRPEIWEPNILAVFAPTDAD